MGVGVTESGRKRKRVKGIHDLHNTKNRREKEGETLPETKRGKRRMRKIVLLS